MGYTCRPFGAIYVNIYLQGDQDWANGRRRDVQLLLGIPFLLFPKKSTIIERRKDTEITQTNRLLRVWSRMFLDVLGGSRPSAGAEYVFLGGSSKIPLGKLRGTEPHSSQVMLNETMAAVIDESIADLHLFLPTMISQRTHQLNNCTHLTTMYINPSGLNCPGFMPPTGEHSFNKCCVINSFKL